jgi:hypothetical protein
VIWIGLLLFFLVVPAVAAYQSGSRTTLILPGLLVLVCVQWVLVDHGDSEGLSGIALGLAILGLAVGAYAAELGRRRRTGR